MENKYLIKNNKADKASELIAEILFSKFQAHIFHWQAKNGDVHRAVGDYYDGISGLIDSVVEGYQGKYGVVTKYSADLTIMNSREVADYIKYFKSLASKVEQNRSSMGSDSYIQNGIDEIVSLLYTTIYKLKELP